MSRLCAKPTCGETAVSWLDILREERRVLEQHRESVHGLALCRVHRSRFVVPAGWELEGQDADTSTAEPKPEVVAPLESSVPQRSGSRERPWFFAGAATDAPVRPLLVAHDSDNDIDIHNDVDNGDHKELAGGSLLRRAFHGPDRDDDLARRADIATDVELPDADERYDLETARTIRALDECGTAQLPFPPAHTDVQAAVS